MSRRVDLLQLRSSGLAIFGQVLSPESVQEYMNICSYIRLSILFGVSRFFKLSL